MSCSVSIRRSDGLPLGDRETVERAISAVFPTVGFYEAASGAEKIAIMRARGVEFPDVIKRFLEQQPATRQGDLDCDVENDGFSVRFFLGSEPEIRSILVELRGETERAASLLERLSAQNGWVVQENG